MHIGLILNEVISIIVYISDHDEPKPRARIRLVLQFKLMNRFERPIENEYYIVNFSYTIILF